MSPLSDHELHADESRAIGRFPPADANGVADVSAPAACPSSLSTKWPCASSAGLLFLVIAQFIGALLFGFVKPGPDVGRAQLGHSHNLSQLEGSPGGLRISALRSLFVVSLHDSNGAHFWAGEVLNAVQTISAAQSPLYGVTLGWGRIGYSKEAVHART